MRITVIITTLQSAQRKQMPWNIPIFLTWLRVLLIPVLTALFYLPFPWFAEETINLAAAVVFAVAALTDWFDGFLARLWKQTSDFGAFLDPVADKLMVAVSLLLLVKLDRTYVLFAMIIIRIARMDGANGQKEQRCRRHRRQV